MISSIPPFLTTESTEDHREQCAQFSVYLRVLCGKSVCAFFAWFRSFLTTESTEITEIRCLFNHREHRGSQRTMRAVSVYLRVLCGKSVCAFFRWFRFGESTEDHRVMRSVLRALCGKSVVWFDSGFELKKGICESSCGTLFGRNLMLC